MIPSSPSSLRALAQTGRRTGRKAPVGPRSCWRRGWCTMPPPRTSAGWTACGACTSGSTARQRGATRRGSGGAAMTSTTRDEHDANARTDMASRRGVVPWHVDRDDGGDDAAVLGPDAMALPPGRPRPVDHTCGRGLLRRLDSVRYGRVSARSRAAEPPPDRHRCDRPAGRLPPVHRVEGASPRRCREAGRDGVPADAGTAWRYGLSLGLHCSQCCVGLMAILLVIGVMNVLAMAVVAAAITVERLAPAGERVARATGAAALGAGLFLIVRAAGLG